jgi:hypothetical protein
MITEKCNSTAHDENTRFFCNCGSKQPFNVSQKIDYLSQLSYTKLRFLIRDILIHTYKERTEFLLQP